jgi:hypothetical protein
MSIILRSLLGVVSTRPGLAKASLIDGKLLAWTLFAVVILAVGIYALSVSLQPNVDGLVTIAVPP